MSSAPRTDTLVSSELAAELFSPLKNLPALAVAVSGGADSLALLYLYSNWKKENAPSQDSLVLTVDHKLRKQSRAEARGVAEICNRIGLPHKILVWNEEHPKSNIQAVAREKRYELMESEMTKIGIKHLLLAHHKNDQAETFLNRLARGSGVYGLAAMSKQVNFGNLVLLRPLLDVTKDQLIATLETADWSWFEDQTNKDLKYLRTKIRNLIPVLEDVGITVERLAGTAQRMQRVVSALNYSIDVLAKIAIERHPAGPTKLDVKSILDAPEEISMRLLANLVCVVGGNKYVPRFEKIENLYMSITGKNNQKFKILTVGGTQFEISKRDNKIVWLFREYGSGIEQQKINPGESYFWDNRFQIAISDNSPGAVNVCALRDFKDSDKLIINFPTLWPKKNFQTAPVISWENKSEQKNNVGERSDQNIVIPGLTGQYPKWLRITERTVEKLVNEA